jgi:site-specific DNA-methyltransferase (adenine-specific)
MDKIADHSVDMVLCDLPYGVTQNKIDVVIPFEPLWKQYERITKDNAAIILFSQGLFYVDLVNSNRKMFKYDLVWNKELTSGFLNANRMPLRVHEQMAVFYKETPTYNPQKELGNKNHSKGKPKGFTNLNYGKHDFVDNSELLGDMKNPVSIITFQKPHPSIAVHPTQKPVDLLRYLIRTYSNEGDTILDNTMGSGSTGVACIKEKRNFIGIELDDKYFDIAKKRIETESKQLTLF